MRVSTMIELVVIGLLAVGGVLVLCAAALVKWYPQPGDYAGDGLDHAAVGADDLDRQLAAQGKGVSQ